LDIKRLLALKAFQPK